MGSFNSIGGCVVGVGFSVQVLLDNAGIVAIIPHAESKELGYLTHSKAVVLASQYHRPQHRHCQSGTFAAIVGYLTQVEEE
jgi:hypothetical protein